MKLTPSIEDSRFLKGRWVLGPNHELEYRSEDFSEELKLKASLVAAEPGGLLVSVTQRQKDQKIVTRLFRLLGQWRANEKNQIQFEIEKEKGHNNVLTFQSGWTIDKRHRVVTRTKAQDLKTKRKTSRTLEFDGFWDLTEKNRLTYFIGGESQSALRFRGAFQTHSVLAKRDSLRYQIGLEVSGKPKTRTLTFFGKWKLSRNFELSFEIAANKGQVRTIRWGAEYHLDRFRQIVVALKNKRGEPLGVEITFTRDFIKKDGQFFVRLQKSLEESSMEAGLRFRW